MWIFIIVLYVLVSVVDISTSTKSNKKNQLLLYISLMSISCAIGIASNYISNIPSPAWLIKDVVIYIIGR